MTKLKTIPIGGGWLKMTDTSRRRHHHQQHHGAYDRRSQMARTAATARSNHHTKVKGPPTALQRHSRSFQGRSMSLRHSNPLLTLFPQTSAALTTQFLPITYTNPSLTNTRYNKFSFITALFPKPYPRPLPPSPITMAKNKHTQQLPNRSYAQIASSNSSPNHFQSSAAPYHQSAWRFFMTKTPGPTTHPLKTPTQTR